MGSCALTPCTIKKISMIKIKILKSLTLVLIIARVESIHPLPFQAIA